MEQVCVLYFNPFPVSVLVFYFYLEGIRYLLSKMKNCYNVKRELLGIRWTIVEVFLRFL